MFLPSPNYGSRIVYERNRHVTKFNAKFSERDSNARNEIVIRKNKNMYRHFKGKESG